MRKNVWYFLLVLTIILCFVIVFVFLALTRFVEIPLQVAPELIIASEGPHSFAIVKFADHPPWSHSRFFVAEYDYDSKKITLGEYFMPYHPFSKSINTDPLIVLKNLDGEYTVCTKTKNLGRLVFENDQIEWIPVSDAVHSD